jgi:heme/copper-type cytochrome/quinol oxidase subunit 3
MDEATHPTEQAPAFAETRELHERIDRIGFGLIAGATIFFFLSFVFAFFYLRSLNNHDLWRPSGVNPPDGWGVVIVAAFVLCAASFGWAARVAGRGRGWVAASGIALAFGLLGCAAQAFEYAHISFGPESGGYASVFFGWTALYVVVALLALYRVETIFAAGIRNRGQAPPEGFASGAHYWALLAAIGVLAWIILYLL